jgi:hypothetical protein
VIKSEATAVVLDFAKKYGFSTVTETANFEGFGRPTFRQVWSHDLAERQITIDGFGDTATSVEIADYRPPQSICGMQLANTTPERLYDDMVLTAVLYKWEDSSGDWAMPQEVFDRLSPMMTEIPWPTYSSSTEEARS